MVICVKVVLLDAMVTPARSVVIPVSSSLLGGYRTVMAPMMRLPARAMMLKAVFSCPSCGTVVLSAVLISGIRRLSARIWGPVDAVHSASAAVIHLVSRWVMALLLVFQVFEVVPRILLDNFF